LGEEKVVSVKELTDQEYWEKEMWSDLAKMTTPGDEYIEVKRQAFGRLKKRGINLDKVVGEQSAVKERLVQATKVAATGVPKYGFRTVDEAKDELRKYFEVGIDIATTKKIEVVEKRVLVDESIWEDLARQYSGGKLDYE
jgi:hypothetical protein